MPQHPYFLLYLLQKQAPCQLIQVVYPGTLNEVRRPALDLNKLYPRYNGKTKLTAQYVKSPLERASHRLAGGGQ